MIILRTIKYSQNRKGPKLVGKGLAEKKIIKITKKPHICTQQVTKERSNQIFRKHFSSDRKF